MITDLSVAPGLLSVDIQWVRPVCITPNEGLLQKELLIIHPEGKAKEKKIPILQYFVRHHEIHKE